MKTKFQILILITIISISLLLAGCGGVSKSNLEKAIEDLDSESLIKLIKQYNEEEQNDKYDDFLKDELDALMSDVNYENYKFVRDTTYGIYGTGTFAVIDDLLKTHYKDEVTAFLNSQFVRCDYTDMDGIVLAVTLNDDNGVAEIADTDNIISDSYGFTKGDVKWDNIEIIDNETFTYNDLGKGDGSSYMKALAKINYKDASFSVHITYEYQDIRKIGTEQRWVRKSEVEKYKDVPVLTDEDFIQIIEVPSESISESINAFSDDDNTFFVIFTKDDLEEVLKEMPDASIKTKRGITINDRKDIVQKTYGLGSGITGFVSIDPTIIGLNHIFKANDESTNALDKLCSDATSYLVYTGENRKGKAIEFFFNENDEVIGIVYIKERPDEHIEYRTDGSTKWID